MEVPSRDQRQSSFQRRRWHPSDEEVYLSNTECAIDTAATLNFTIKERSKFALMCLVC